MISARHAFALAGALAFTSMASATVFELELSNFSSDETDPGVLNATFSFSVVGNTLSLTVTNDTVVPNEYTINEIYFNFGGGIDSVSAGALPADWSFATDVMVDGMGIFDICVTDGVGGDPSTIAPGESLKFDFTFVGSGDEKDFTGAKSTNGFFIAAKFITGPGDDSAFGGLVPAPGVLGLLAVAGLASRRRRRRD